MIKKWLVVSLVFIALMIIGFASGCGQGAQTTTTTTTLPAGSALGVTINGSTATGATTGLSVKKVGAASLGLAGATVIVGVPTKDSDVIRTIATGTTNSDGNYSVAVATSELETLKSGGTIATNVMVMISKEGTVIGCVIPSLSLEAGVAGYAPTATPGDYKKQLIARSAFKKGTDPKAFDYSGNIDRKFSSDSLQDYDTGKIGAMADSIRSGEDAESKIAAGLGISATILNQMRQKGFELHQTYIEPIMRASFDSKTPPSRVAMDVAFASMEAAMSAYARELGLSGQQIADMKAMKDKQIETKMGESTELKDDPSFREAKRRMAGDKLVNMFLGQWEAANTLATTAPSGKTTFAASHEAAYNTFVASKESIKTHLLALQNTANISPETISCYLRTNFFDEFLYPPETAKNAAGESPSDSDTTAEALVKQASMESFMTTYASSRIMMYFMNVFLTCADRDTFFRTTQPAMQAIFQTRFSSESSNYYMGEKFWNGTTLGRRPTPDDINTRLALFDTALTNAIDNTTTRDIIKTRGKFDETQTVAILKAFRILMAPPDAM